MTKPPSRPTVLDVARQARVGASTVSRHLRGGKNVSVEVSERVAKAIEKLGYEPDELARGLRGGRTRTIGVVFPQIANSFFSRCVQMIEQEATSRGCAVILLTHQEDSALQLKQLATLKRYRADGIVLTAAPGSSFATLQSELAGLPLVALDRPLWDEADSVILKNSEAAYEATTHLLEHGHTRIACVTGAPEVYSFQERISGYREAMRARCTQDQLVVARDYDQLRTAVLDVLTSDRRPTALFTLSNMATFSALTALKELQLAPKEEPALIGFDDVGYADLVSPAITTVRQPTDMLARHAVNLLFRRILNEGNGRVEHISLAGELRYRRSCGCVH